MKEKRALGINDVENCFQELWKKIGPRTKGIRGVVEDTVGSEQVEDKVFLTQLGLMLDTMVEDLNKTEGDYPDYQRVVELIEKTHHFSFNPNIMTFLIVLMIFQKLYDEDEFTMPSQVPATCIGAFKVLSYMYDCVEAGNFRPWE